MNQPVSGLGLYQVPLQAGFPMQSTLRASVVAWAGLLYWATLLAQMAPTLTNAFVVRKLAIK